MSSTPPRNSDSARAREEADEPSPSTQRARAEEPARRTANNRVGPGPREQQNKQTALRPSAPGAPAEAADAALRDTRSEQPAFTPELDVSSDEQSVPPDGGLVEAKAKAKSSGRNSPEDTLLSLPAPADGRDVEVDDRLAELDRRLDELASRVRVLERAPVPAASDPTSRANQWTIWVLFLLTLALAWQIFRTSR